VETRPFFLQLARKHSRVLAGAEWSEWDVPEGWFGLVAHLVGLIDAAVHLNADAECFEFVEMAECSGHLVVIATYPRHLDPVVDGLLVAAWDASEGVCMRCGSYAVTTTPLCSAHILGRGT